MQRSLSIVKLYDSVFGYERFLNVKSSVIRLNSTDTNWSRQQYIEVLDAGISWIRGLGIRVPEHGRHFKYRKILVEYASHEPGTNDGSWGVERTASIVNAKLETHELDRIRRQFVEIMPIGLDRKLHALVKGAPHYRNEVDKGGSSKLARNTATELAIGAYMNRHGFEIEYGDHSFPEPLVSISGRHFAMQCKRVATISNETTIDAMKKASRQITGNIKKWPKIESGITVYDISKLVNPQGMVLFCESDEKYANSEARFRMHKFFGEFVNGFPFWDFPQTIGIIVTASFMLTKDPSSGIDSYICPKLFKDSPGHTVLSDYLCVNLVDRKYSVESHEISSKTWFS